MQEEITPQMNEISPNNDVLPKKSPNYLLVLLLFFSLVFIAGVFVSKIISGTTHPVEEELMFDTETNQTQQFSKEDAYEISDLEQEKLIPPESPFVSENSIE